MVLLYVAAGGHQWPPLCTDNDPAPTYSSPPPSSSSSSFPHTGHEYCTEYWAAMAIVIQLHDQRSFPGDIRANKWDFYTIMSTFNFCTITLPAWNPVPNPTDQPHTMGYYSYLWVHWMVRWCDVTMDNFFEKSNQVLKNHKIIPTHKHTSIYTPTTRGWRKGEENEKSFRLGSSSEIDGSATNPLLMSPWHSLNDRPSPLRISKASVIRRNENAVAASCS